MDRYELKSFHLLLAWSMCVLVVQLTFGHVLGDNVNGLLGHHGVKRDQFVVSELLHDLGLLQEGLWRHGARLQGLDGHLGGAVPSACRNTVQEVYASPPRNPD